MNTRYVRNQRAVREHLISTKTQTKSLLFRLAILRHFSPGLPSPSTQNLTTTLVSCSEHQLYFCYSISRAIKNCACNYVEWKFHKDNNRQEWNINISHIQLEMAIERERGRRKEGEPAAVGRQSTLQIKRRRQTGGGRINLHLKAVFSSIFTTNRGPQL